MPIKDCNLLFRVLKECKKYTFDKMQQFCTKLPNNFVQNIFTNGFQYVIIIAPNRKI